MLKYTLVPEEFFEPAAATSLLSQAVQLSKGEKVSYKELPLYKAVLVYVPDAGDAYPIVTLTDSLAAIKDYNKFAISWDGSELSVALATGGKLLLVNSFPAGDATTAEYFIFAVLKQFQINPEVTVANFITKVPYRMQNDLIRYFKGVETI